MGFYLRKSISVGPLRFNFSSAGIGVSGGVKGFRVSTGPRGNYIHMGQGGLYYRVTIPSNASPAIPITPSYNIHTIPVGTHAPLEDIESADVSEIVDSSSKDLLNEINEKQKRPRFWPIIAIVSVIVFGMVSNNGLPGWVAGLIILSGCIATYVTYTKDILAKTVVLFYEFDRAMESAYEQLHKAAEELAACSAAWHIESSGQVYDPKYHAGASTLLSRKNTTIKKSEPPFLKTNIETISIGVGRQTLHFFPDRVLVYEKNGVGAVSYKELTIEVSGSRFIEEESVPRDATVVDHTWKYVNKSGGPDKRFKDNREIPICLYEAIKLSSSNGLNELIQVSKNGVGSEFSQAIHMLGRNIPEEASKI
ncbi:hypothetical protein A7981_11355 [Methylovorus sp. MM2]|uniref:DUF4236 domain-containing protein n=1 Tax=Methylovorus sp. MM2 TaxID=1848038 RepID=UPI0007E04F28|nr:DUF4236 domain-containing protein [Methylovorus sp. MM2]OAM51315.1 hypothetical protein A7981_11355 [Methylovorus sp. MM2]